MKHSGQARLPGKKWEFSRLFELARRAENVVKGVWPTFGINTKVLGQLAAAAPELSGRSVLNICRLLLLLTGGFVADLGFVRPFVRCLVERMGLFCHTSSRRPLRDGFLVRFLLHHCIRYVPGSIPRDVESNPLKLHFKLLAVLGVLKPLPGLVFTVANI